jgi:glutamine amidotransferase-like uncharacterized protein
MPPLIRLGLLGIIFSLPLAGVLLPKASGAGQDAPQLKLTPATTLPAAAASPLRVALYKGTGTGGAGPTNLMKYFNSGTNAVVLQLTADEIAQGALTGFQAVVFGGGSGSKEAASIGEAGRQQVKEFIRNGGGYIGICAGAYLATSGYTWSLHVLNAKTVSPKWKRGKGTVKIELTDAGRQILGERTGLVDVLYHNGPVIKSAELPDLEKFEPLAYFRTELAENDTPKGLMVDSPAIVAGHFGKGRVICISPHPEQTPGLESLVEKALLWVAPARAKPPANP